MSLLIKGMNMPKNCVDCKLRDFSILGTYCIITHKPVFADKYENERHENCPLVEIPTPHGRLIDARRLIVALKNSVYANAFFRTPTLTMSQIEQLIEHQPTIIEAEGNT